MGRRFLRLRANLSTAPVVILIRDGKTVLVKGSVSASILAAFRDISRAHRIDQAMITVRRPGGSDVLGFSGDVPDAARQRFRNIWFSFPQRKAMKV
ncbi:MAG: DUF3634 family protein [Candidatus Sulfobium sp.]|jgi:Protein of unknown function (DUF3634)